MYRNLSCGHHQAIQKVTIAGLSWLALGISGSALAPPAFGQSKPAVELESAISKEQVDGDLKTAIVVFQKIAADTSASRDVRARALLHLAGCYEKIGQQAQSVYQQIVRDFGDQPAAAQARARLVFYSARQTTPPREIKPQRLTANTPELTIQAAALSPNGKFMAYSDQLGIHVRAMESGRTRLIPGTAGQLLLQWMSDGDAVQTQQQSASGETTATLVPLNGGPPVQLRSPDAFVSSPDGSHRAILAPDHLQIRIQDANGGHAEQVWTAANKSTVDQLAWSPNGGWIAVLSSSKGENGYQSPSTMELIDIVNNRQNKVLVAPAQKLNIGSIAWPSQNRIIAALDEDSGPNQYVSSLWEIRLKGDGTAVVGGLRKLTAWTDFPIRPGSLSTDGKRLVLIRSFRQRDVYVAPLAAGGTRLGILRRLTLDLGDDYPSDWTRDSKTVIFTSTRNGSQTVYRQDLEKLIAEQIVVMPGKQALARVTPDGNALLFMNRDPDSTPQNQLMTVAIRGGTAKTVPNTVDAGWYYRCVPAGVCLNAEGREGSGFIISELELAKGKGREIYRDAHMEHPDISPDGKWIADTAGTGSNTRIILRSFSSGSVEREIPVRGVSKLITFGYAPDGKGFYCGDSSQNYDRELYVDLSGNISVLYSQPASVWGIWGIPSPDGKYLALVLVTDDSNIYIVENF